MHALHDSARRGLWELAAGSLRAGGRLYPEFRTGKDEGARHVFGEHFRRFLDADTVVDEIEARGGTSSTGTRTTDWPSAATRIRTSAG